MKLLLVDDQNVVREALAFFLGSQPDITRVVQADGVEHALAAQQHHRFHVAIIELALGDRTGADLIRRLKSLADTRVLVLSASRDEFSVGEAMRAGADGYLSKRAQPSDLLDAI